MVYLYDFDWYVASFLAFFLLFFLKKIIRDFHQKGWEEWMKKYSRSGKGKYGK